MVQPHRIRHACGDAVATQRHDPRTIQDYLGHRDPQPTAFDNPNRRQAVREPVALNGMSETRKPAEWSLLETGTLVGFRVVDTHLERGPDPEQFGVRAELVFEGDDGADPAEIAAWGAFGFLFALATLSFHDARPRGASGLEFHPHDAFTVADFFACLSFCRDGLRLEADYVRGRRMKTTVTVRPDGTVTLATWGRGRSAVRWLDQLQGRKWIAAVPPGGD